MDLALIAAPSGPGAAAAHVTGHARGAQGRWLPHVGRIRLPRGARGARAAVAIAVLALVCAGCHPEERLAELVRAQYPDIITRGDTQPGNWLDPAGFTLYVAPGTSRSVVREIACVFTQKIAADAGIHDYIYVEVRTEDGAVSEGGTISGCVPESPE